MVRAVWVAYVRLEAQGFGCGRQTFETTYISRAAGSDDLWSSGLAACDSSLTSLLRITVRRMLKGYACEQLKDYLASSTH